MKQRKRTAKELGLQINEAKRSMDEVKARLEEIKNEKVISGEHEDVMTEEEYKLFLQMKELKKTYKEKFEAMKMAKSEADHVAQLIERSNHELIEQVMSTAK